MNSLTDAQYAAFIDRLISCREAEDAAKEDTKQVYAELADAGEDKTAAGLIVRGLRMSAKDRAKANLRDAAVDHGLDRYNRGKASHVRVREAIPSHDPITGEIADEIPMSHASGQPGGDDPETTDDAASAGEDGELIHESTGASQERARTATGLGAGGDNLAPRSRPTATAKTGVPTYQSQASGGGQSQDNSGVRVVSVDANNEPVATMRPQTGAAETLVANSRPAEGVSAPLTQGGSPTSSAGTEGEADRQPHSEAADLATVTVAEAALVPRVAAASEPIADISKPNPICRDPKDCGVYASWHLTCEACKRAAAHRVAA